MQAAGFITIQMDGSIMANIRMTDRMDAVNKLMPMGLFCIMVNGVWVNLLDDKSFLMVEIRVRIVKVIVSYVLNHSLCL